jgi:hypothetical protein
MRPLSIAVAALLIGGSLVFAVAPPPMVAPKTKRLPVIDRAKLFSPAAVANANKFLQEVRDEYKIDLCLDTFEELPGEYGEKFRKLKGRRQKRFLRETAQNLADDAGVNGIYILATNEPLLVEMVGWPRRREGEDLPLEEGGGLSKHKRDTLRNRFARGLAPPHHPDEALTILVHRFRADVQSRLSPEPSPLETLPALVVVGCLFGAWLLLSLLRRISARREAAATYEPVRQIYQPAMLGSLFGVPAGFWVYDRLFHLERPPAPPVTVEEAPHATSTAITAQLRREGKITDSPASG